MSDGEQLDASRLTKFALSRILDSRRLLYFYQVAVGGSFTAAEMELDIAQPALSRQIKQLEIELGVKLLERRGHGVEPTATGRVLLEHAKELLAHMSKAIDEINLAKMEPRDRVSIAVSRPFSTNYMPEVISRFVTEHPSIHLSVYEASSGQVYEMLTTGAVDLAVVLIEANSSKLTTTKLFDEQLLVTGSSNHPELRGNYVKRADLPQLDLILPAAPFGTRFLLEHYFKAGGIDLDPALRSDSISLMKEVIRKTAHCALLPTDSCQAEIDSGEFVAIPLKPALKRTLRIAHKRDHKHPEPLVALRDRVIEVVAELRHQAGLG